MLVIMAGMLLLQFINEVLNIPVVAQRTFPMVQTVMRTIEIPQLLLFMVVDAPVMPVVPGFHTVIITVVTQSLLPMVQPAQQTIEISQLQFAPGG